MEANTALPYEMKIMSSATEIGFIDLKTPETFLCEPMHGNDYGRGINIDVNVTRESDQAKPKSS